MKVGAIRKGRAREDRGIDVMRGRDEKRERDRRRAMRRHRGKQMRMRSW